MLEKKKTAPKKDRKEEIAKEDLRRENGLLTIGIDIRKITRPIIKDRKKKAYLPELLMYYAEILPEIKDVSQPVRLSPKGILTLETTSAAAGLEIQHKTPVFIERINTFFGDMVVNGIQTKPVMREKPKEKKREKSKADKKELEKNIPKDMPENLRKKLLEILAQL